MPTPGISDDLVVDLSDEPVAAAPKRSWQYPVLIGSIVVTLVAGVLALVLSRDGEPTPTQALAEVREFVTEARTATFVATMESTYRPESGDIGHTSTSRSRATGEMRLPDHAHLVIDDGDFATEYILNGAEHYTRDAESVAGLSGVKWTRWTADELEGSDSAGIGPGGSLLGGPGGFAVGTATEVLGMFASGAPVELDTLFEKLKDPVRVGPNRVRATAKLADIVPDEVKQAVEKMYAEIEADGSEVPGSPFDGTITVTVEYGAKGRLDVLTIDVEQASDEEQTLEHEEIRFADWGKPVTIEAPGAAQVDQTPHIEEELLAQAQSRFTVLAPAAPPAGWKLYGLTVEENDDDLEMCESVDLQYMPGNVDPEAFDFSDEEEPPALALSSIASSCKWLEGMLPDLEDARRVRVGAWTARVIPADEENDFFNQFSEGLTAVVVVSGTTVVATTNLTEAELVAVLRTLAPLDLSKQAIATQ